MADEPQVVMSRAQRDSFLEVAGDHPYSVRLIQGPWSPEYVTAQLLDPEGRVVEERIWNTNGEPPRKDPLPPSWTDPDR